jgi:hypothetical protein
MWIAYFFFIGLNQAEVLMTLEDLQVLAPPPPVVEEPLVAAASAKGKPAAKGKHVAVEEPPADLPPVRPPLVSDDWKAKVEGLSAVRGAVSTAHRLLVSERDAGLQGYSTRMLSLINENKIYYGKILQQEDSWNERWQMQVEMLKQGNL